MSRYPYTLTFTAGTLEVVDAQGVPLLLMAQQSVLEQALPHRQVRVALRDTQNRVLLVRTLDRDGHATPWMLPGGCVQAGEACEDAAMRILEQELGLGGIPLLLWEHSRPNPLPEHMALFHSISVPLAPRSMPQYDQEFLFLDKDELHGLALHFPDLLAPALVRFIAKAPHVLHMKR